ncbi:flagellar biosynthetic protein FliR [Poseidonocella sedimentorum]|uniref:Flagellar biosynthetic protein FliR n=1 Tax=Poseidonocella sedimentorum TaxID=871652 RepID=A0A1I6D5S6_9RHOB|nr:flagellar biosynthetic protein FliR [Poseidonocella sedimentorum]SFR00711.1 flagellar biosynthetic protein FliR [Poseidonocella sedimentorum]
MTEELTATILSVQGILAAGFIIMLRVGAMMAVLPAFGERAVPMQVRLVIILAFTVIVTPIIAPENAVTLDAPLKLLALALPETIIGLAHGITLRLFILALSTAGSIAAQSTSLSQILGGAAADPMPAIGHLFVISGLALAVLYGFHTRVVEWIVLSYEIFPIGRMPDAGILTQWGTERVAASFAMAFTLAAPFVLASLLYNLTLGFINKAMPQLMVAFVGAPVITLGGLFILFASSPILLRVWVTALNGFVANPYGGGP